jgi:ADP-ribose pyrophosphatase YjhB (NUDIX family)
MTGPVPERPDLPGDLPVVERQVVRVVVQDAARDVLLLLARDLTEPELGTWWELPGGGLDDGETYADAAVRELAEETGIAIRTADVGPATWRRSATFRYRGRRHLQHEVVALVRIAERAPDLDVRGRLHYEAEDYPDHRWWPLADLRASTDRFYPGRLPAHVDDLLAGREVDEPFETFS